MLDCAPCRARATSPHLVGASGSASVHDIYIHIYLSRYTHSAMCEVCHIESDEAFHVTYFMYTLCST